MDKLTDKQVEHIDTAIDAIDMPEEVYMSKELFGAIPDDDKETMGPNEPIVEKALGSTKQLGEYGDLPVYSHGRVDKGSIYVNGGEGSQIGRDKGWFKDGEPIPPPAQG